VKPNGVRAVLFDLDGTFADTAPDLARALNRVRAARGLPPLPPEIARPWTSSGARGLLKAGFGITPDDPDYGVLRGKFLDFYEEDLCVETRIFDGVPEVIAKMRARKLPWGIVTNKGKRFTEPLLRLLAVDHLAACAVSGDSTPHTKPHPAPLLLAAKLLELEPGTCLYVGDDLRDAQAARAAGMPFAAAGWGYLGESGDPSAWSADAVLEHPRDILDLLP
jgi:N-acetyl-D-muramate 6-phosphate phosphatase